MTHPLPVRNTLERSIDIHAPLSMIYNQWARYEDYPKFMEGVREVRQVSNERLHWRAVIGGREREWDADIVEQTVDTRIAWQSRGGLADAGMVSFTTVYGGTRVSLQLTLDPEDVPTDAGAAKDVLMRRVEGNLQRFKEYLESLPAVSSTPCSGIPRGPGARSTSRSPDRVDPAHAGQGRP